jgi:FkbM family methyltransferase
MGAAAKRSMFIGKIREKFVDKYPQFVYFPSYSQWGEDAVLSQYLHESKGNYIDIGSGHPILGNNTYFLYRRGWSGVLVDPILTNVKLSRRYRKRDTVFNNICSDISSPITFYEFNSYGYSTANEQRAESLVNDGLKIKEKYQVSSISLSSIIATNYQNSRELPALLSIDVEGLELEVLRSNNWSVYKPKVICIEILDGSQNNGGNISHFLVSQNYSLKASCGNSKIFCLDQSPKL